MSYVLHKALRFLSSDFVTNSKTKCHRQLDIFVNLCVLIFST